MPIEITVKFIERDTCKEEEIIFYSYESLGIWVRDNYEFVEIMNINPTENR